jgi:thiol-disulfide isomerase/thioredoxin
VPKLNKLNISCISYSDITSKYSYKLFNIVDGYESDLPCLRYLKFTNNKLFFTKKNNIDLLDKNIENKIYDFINNTFYNKLFFHEYNNNYNYNNKYNNNIYRCDIKKNVIELYYNEWCEYCLELFILIEDVFTEFKYLRKYFKIERHLVSNFPLNLKNKGNKYDLYFNFLPRLYINDIFINVTYEFFGDYTKDNILNFMIDKLNLLNNFQEIY